MRRRLAGAMLAALCAARGYAEPVRPAPSAVAMPADAPARHLGVAACAGSLCHSTVKPWRGSGARLNEAHVWRTADPHARAYDVLLEPPAQAMARRLGLDAPERATLCLDCHADHPAARGPAFRVSDGVGCEACHGGAEHWLDSHARGAGHADNVARGMYPTADPAARAALCVTCHVGTRTRQVTHRLYAAGHPRLVFELDTFTARQPSHAVVDEDYRRRKPEAVVDSATLWAIGQRAVARQTLELLTDPNAWGRGAWPELSLFDCAMCHRPVDGARLAPMARPIGRPGLPRVHDASIRLWAEVVGLRNAEQADWIRRTLTDLDDAVARGREDRARRAAALRHALLRDDTPAVIAREDLAPLLQRLARCDGPTALRRYLEAEQLAMAVQAVAATAGANPADDPRLARLFAAARGINGFAPRPFVEALNALCRPTPAR